jgi:hypothetical protein
MEHGFFHPERGYWQTVELPPADIRECYPEGTLEVPLRPSAQHHWIDGAWVEAVPDIGAARAAALTAMADWISGFTARFTAGYPPEEVAAWPVKAAAARAHLAGIASPLIEAEAALTGEDVDDLAALIAGMADQYEAVIARVTGLRRATRDAIMAAETPEAVTAVLTAAKAQAEAMIEELALPYA